MPDVFGSQPGKVAVVVSANDVATLGVMVIGTENLRDATGSKALITSLATSSSSGFQVMHTLRQYIYVYTFGERMAETNIGGFAFVNDCESSEGSGLARLQDWYERNTISHRASTINLTITTGLIVRAFLTNFTYQVVDPNISLGQFTMKLIHPPRVLPREWSRPKYKVPKLLYTCKDIVLPPE